MHDRLPDEVRNDPEPLSPNQPLRPTRPEAVPLSSHDVHDVPKPIGSDDLRGVPSPPSERDVPKSNPRTLLTIIGGLLAVGFGIYITWLMLQPEPDFDAMPSPFSEEAERQEATP